MFPTDPDDSKTSNRDALDARTAESVFPGDGEMARIMRATDWAKTPVGPVESWPPALRMMCRVLLTNRFPMLLWWGPQFLQFYNDAYRPILGKKHPQFLGRTVSECWSEIWNVLEPLIRTPFEGGPATWDDDFLFEINRYGFTEETHFTIAYSPVPDDTAPHGVGGVLATVHEITSKVVGERRSRALRDICAKGVEEKTTIENCTRAAELLAHYPMDIPFLLLYLLDADRKSARLVATAGIQADSSRSLSLIQIGGTEPAIWPFADIKERGQIFLVEDLPDRLPQVPSGPWSDPPTHAAVLPIQPNIAFQPAGYLVAGLSPRLRFDDSYQGFLELIASQIATAVADSRAFEEARERAQSLAELDRAKTVFFTNISHEFRTPLALMMAPLEDTLSNSSLPAEARGNIELVQRNSFRLHKLVNALLDFSRIEAGRAEAVFEPVELAAFTAHLASTFRSAIERAGLQLLIDCPTLDQPAYVDREMWEKIVLNLISNAFKFTLQGQIEVKVRQSGDHAVFSVCDTGVGIAAEELPHIFERFRRAKHLLGRSFEGSGIGLALVQELVKLHGGNIQVASEPGKGTTFTISLRLGTSHLPAHRIGARHSVSISASSTSAFTEEAFGWLPDATSQHSDLELAKPADANTVQVGPRCPRILVADDNADMREYIRGLLSVKFAVEAYTGGRAALTAAIEHTPDLVVSDVMMPELDGFALLKALRSNESTASVPVILLSALAGEESRVDGLRAGADDYLVKPFSARELIARVEGCLALARLRRESESRLRESEERFRALVAASSDVVFRLTPDWSEILLFHGREFNASQPRVNWLERYIYPDDHAKVRAAINEAIRTKSAFQLEHRVIRKNDSTGWIFSRAVPLFNNHGDVVEWFGAASDITGRKLIEHQINQQSRAKDEFLALLGHELRNPLAAIDNATQLLSGANDEQRSSLDSLVSRQVQVLRRLVDDLLDLSRMGQGKIPLKKEPTDLAELLEAQAMVFQAQVAARKQELILHLPSQPVEFMADRVRLEQIVANLLDNASKYTGSGGRIELSGAVEDSEIVVRCIDNGKGIPAELTQSIFEPFFRGNTAHTSDEPGLGIGLALVKSLAELHNGTISLKSGEPGKGSEFTLRLPWVKAEALLKAPEIKSPLRRARHSVSIAMVEDNPDVARTRKLILEQAGHRVTVFADAASALADIPPLKPAALLIDIGLPDMDGYAMAAMLRKDPALHRACFIAISGFKRRTRTAGCNDPFDHYFAKPVDQAELVEILDACEQQVTEESPTDRSWTDGRAPLRLLLVEDHAGVAEATAILARSQGFEVRIASSGGAALELAPQFRPHLALCDLHLPDMSGRDVVHRLQTDPVTSDILSVILTAASRAETQAYNDSAKASGRDELYLSKPLNAETLRGLLARYEQASRTASD